VTFKRFVCIVLLAVLAAVVVRPARAEALDPNVIMILVGVGIAVVVVIVVVIVANASEGRRRRDAAVAAATASGAPTVIVLRTTAAESP
jgi:predicted RND superfamily exporter protein